MKKLLCMILTLMFTLSVAGCAAEAKPEEAVKGYFEAAKQFDITAANKFVNPKNAADTTSSGTEEYEKVFEDFLKTNAKKVTYEIKGTEILDSNAVVTVDCKYVDGTPIFKETMTEYIAQAMQDALSGKEPTDEEAGKQIVTIMTNKQKTLKETFAQKTLKIKCVKIDGKWYLDEAGDDIGNVFSSNLLAAGEEISKSMNEDSSEASGEDSSEATPANADAEASTAAAGAASEDMLDEIYSFTTDKIWNDGFCKVYNYTYDGKTKDGEKINIDTTLSQLTETMNKIGEYDAYINGLSDSKYDKAKETWAKVYSESKLLYGQVQLKKPVINAKTSDMLNVDLLSDYVDDFTGELDKLG